MSEQQQQVMGIYEQGIPQTIVSEKAAHTDTLSTSTYVPYLGMVLKGDHSNSYFKMPNAQMYYANQSLATLTKGFTIDENAHTASKNDPNSDYKRRLYGMAPTIAVEFVASLKKKLWLENQEKKRQEVFIANGGKIESQPGGFNPLVSQLQAQYNPYIGSVPPGGGDNASEVVGPLTQIPFIQDVLGFPTPEYYTNELTTKIALPQLHAEQPETDWGTPNLQLEPTQFAENRRPNFDSHFFLAKRNEFAFFIPREYRYRATIDPYNIYVRQANDGLRQGREALTLLAVSNLPDIATAGGLIPVQPEIPDPTANSGTQAGTGFPAAASNVKSFLENLFAQYWKATRLQIDSVIMNPVDFVNYESNFYTNGFTGYNDVSDWGIVQLPGFKRRIRVAMSPFCPRGHMYMFNSRFVLTGEGPMVTETWAKPEANSDAGAYRDYVDVTIFNPLRAGMKAIILGSTTAREPEITTLEEARNLIKPSSRILEKDQ